ncbi:hypothetical protein [Kribbella sp. NPDC004875]|uniref:hypothetical protein n=1 Tax=Kribbella sp. NPDC004875 TaxID=3364107 RepID=UPI0036998538
MGTQDDKATAAEAAKAGATPDAASTGAASGTAASSTTGTGTATKAARPKTAAEIVAEQRAREQAAAEPASGAAGSEDAATPKTDAAHKDAAAGKNATGNSPAATTGTAGKPVAKAGGTSGASGNKPPTARGGAPGSSGKGKQALSSVGSGVRKLRNLIASLIWLVAVLAAAVLALGALFTALDQTNQSNEIVRWILERGHDLVGPFKDLFRLQTAKNTLLVNWGIAALVYLIAGKIVEKIIRP